MALAIFDLDNTLLNGDCEIAWWEYMAEQGLVERNEFYHKRELALADEAEGHLNPIDYVSCSINAVAGQDLAKIETLRQQFIADIITPMVYPEAHKLLAMHRAQNDYLLIITATNSFVTAPIAKLLKVDALIATEIKRVTTGYIAEIDGIPSFREGKVLLLKQWLEDHPQLLDDSYFYSDSDHDVPLLEFVTHPVATNPNPILEGIAKERNWLIKNF